MAINFLTGDELMSKSDQGVSSLDWIGDPLKSWTMVFLTLSFVVLYGLALIGKLKPLADASMVSRLEPIIFVFIGYYFGRLPAQQNETTLRNEITRQTIRGDAAHSSKEQALQSREALEEKLKCVNAALDVPPALLDSDLGGSKPAQCESPTREIAMRQSLAAARRVLDA
jgi:hypothetical protein